MSLISEIREKSKLIDAPIITISKKDQERLKNGESIVLKEEKTKNVYLVRIDKENIGIGRILKSDLTLERL